MKNCILIIFFSLLLMVLAAMPVFAEELSENTDSNLSALQTVVAENLGAGDYTYELLADFNQSDRYTLVEGDGCYLIYDNVIQNLVEYSTNGNSDYLELDGEAIKIYAGPTYYFYQQDGCVYDISNGQQLDENTVVASTNSAQQYKSLFSVQHGSNIEQLINSNQVSNAGVFDRDIMYYYFYNLHQNMGENPSEIYNGSCGVVAIGMLLSYFDTVLDDKIISEEYDVHSTQNFSAYSNIKISTYSESPGTDIRFQEYLINKAIELKFFSAQTTNYGLSDWQIKKLLSEYLVDNNITAAVNKFHWQPTSNCKELIDEYGPLMIALRTGPYGMLGHFVVAYDYDDEHIFANYGRRTVSFYKNILEDNLDFVFYLQFESEQHSCSDNYRWSCNGSTGTVCVCGQITCYHEAGTNCVSANSTEHNCICKTCGEVVSSENHTFVANGYDQICSKCSYVKKHTHSYTYTPLKLSRHKATCTICGTTKTEACTPVNASIMSTRVVVESHCMFCGQQLPVLNSSLAAQQQIAETFRALAAPQLPAMLP